MDNYAYQSDEGNGKPFAITRYPSVQQNNDYLVGVNSRLSNFKKSRFYKTLAGVLMIVALLLLIALIVLVILYNRKSSLSKACTSEECLRSASNLHLSIDFSTNPCDDFYQFTCGRWSTEHPNHGWFSSFSSFQTVSERVLIKTENFLTSQEQPNESHTIKQAKNFYKSCLDESSIDSLGLSVVYKYLKEAELPLVPSLFTVPEDEVPDFKFDWLRSDAVIKKLLAMDVLIGFAVESNIFNRSENVMYLGVPGQKCPLPSPLKFFRKKHLTWEELRKKANSNIMRFVLKTIITNVTTEEPKPEVLEQAIDVLLNLTSDIDSLVSNYSDYNDNVSVYHIKKFENDINAILLNNCNKEYPSIWEKYINYMFENSNVTIDFDSEMLYLSATDEEYLPKILGYLLTTSDIYLELYMWWVTVFAMIINTSSDVVDYIFKQVTPFYTGMTVLRSRSLDCSLLVNGFMGMAVSYGVADKSFPNSTKPKVQQMLTDIKNAFEQEVNSLKWMDKKTKQATLEKSKEMATFIGYPDWLYNEGALDAYYEDIVLKNDTYLENMMAFAKSYFPSRFEDFRKINERNWSTDPTIVNAFNSFSDNAINLPMAILAFPIYDLGLEVLNYGAIGSVLGHELTHGFDNLGRTHDKFGNKKQWWSNDTINTFEEKIECFVKQYDNLTVEGVDKHVQGLKTLGENLADNGGLNHAYLAYKQYVKRHGKEAVLPGFENFTHDQLFFIAFGSIWCETITLDDIEAQIEYDEHPPNSLRVIGSLQNSVDFAKAFECQKGSKMNPERQKCKVW